MDNSKNVFFWILGSDFFGGLNQNSASMLFVKSIFTSILKFSDKSIENVGGVGILVIDLTRLGENGVLRYGHFCGCLEANMVNLGSIYFSLGLPLNI